MTPPSTDELELVVSSTRELTPRIRSFVLKRPDGGALPSFTPGSHVVVRSGDRRNAYSLTGPTSNPSFYSVSVLRLDGGLGGSAALHALVPGERVAVSAPRSAFAPVATARHHLFVAAGIGITPMLSHLAAAREWGRSFSMLYSYRAGEAAHLDEVRATAGSRLIEITSRDRFRATIGATVAEQPIGTHLYVCGPQGFTDAVFAAADAAGWPNSRLHSELFGAAELDGGEPFSVTLRKSAKTLEVPAGVSLLDALEQAGVRVPFMCRRGVCGECVIPVSGGVPEHRDLFLSPEERLANDCMTSCVSRSVGTELEVAL